MSIIEQKILPLKVLPQPQLIPATPSNEGNSDADI